MRSLVGSRALRAARGAVIGAALAVAIVLAAVGVAGAAGGAASPATAPTAHFGIVLPASGSIIVVHRRAGSDALWSVDPVSKAATESSPPVVSPVTRRAVARRAAPGVPDDGRRAQSGRLQHAHRGAAHLVAGRARREGGRLAGLADVDQAGGRRQAVARLQVLSVHRPSVRAERRDRRFKAVRQSDRHRADGGAREAPRLRASERRRSRGQGLSGASGDRAALLAQARRRGQAPPDRLREVPRRLRYPPLLPAASLATAPT